MAAIRFPYTQFGPMQLRGLLRARFDDGETLVGWGVVQPAARPERVLMHAAWFAIPVVGQILGMMSMISQASHRRLMVMTDRRLLMLHPGQVGAASNGAGVVHDAPIHHVRVVQVRRSMEGLLETKTEREQRPLSFELRIGRGPMERFSLLVNSAGARRLREALLVIMEDITPLHPPEAGEVC